MSKAQRVVLKASEFGDANSYQLSETIALVATQAANGSLFSYRWGSTTHSAVIKSIRLVHLQTAAASATIMPVFQVFVARAFSASDSVGTAITLTTNSFKKKTSNSITLLTDARKSAVAAGLTAGTRTLDASPILSLPVNMTVTTPNDKIYSIERIYDSSPLILGVNEGIIVRGPTIIYGAADTSNLVVEIEWSEVPNGSI